MIKILRITVVTLLVLGLAHSTVMALALADPPESATNTVSIADLSANLVDVNLANRTDITVLEFTITNNHPNSFRITIHSDNDGQYRHPSWTQGNQHAGTFIDYTVKIIPTGAGTLGSTEPVLPNNHDMAAAADGDIVLDFSSATVGTENKVYALQVSTASKDKLLAGNFSETFHVTIDNL